LDVDLHEQLETRGELGGCGKFMDDLEFGWGAIDLYIRRRLLVRTSNNIDSFCQFVYPCTVVFWYRDPTLAVEVSQEASAPGRG
jgi:hypothetical protein